ncbi:TetR/AcrR family transcriptional regulator [Breoghania sp.]|uniref:TetR/AcrR family transcriptional regulator n=1 Tax=Breoghania sp. TaxID=2065378 RepID=UPI0029C9D5BA|nr:TetR/AcrR family transcriptional regulator [Breoghania sp.]
MVTPQRQAASTRDRLLFSACRIFASKGYRDTTVADICDTAQANIASVNYHFGNKESLYRQVFQRLIDLYEPPEPPQNGSVDDSEALLRFYVLDRLEWLVQDDPLERLIRAEMVQPTGLVDDLRVAGLEKTQNHFAAAVGALGGNALSAPTLRLCVTSILSQCRAFMAVNYAGVYTANMPRPSDADLAAYADHVTVFSVAGIKALAQREQAAPLPFTPRTGTAAAS